MIVMMIAITPSLNASMRFRVILESFEFFQSQASLAQDASEFPVLLLDALEQWQ